jgi:hypothetical protein
MGCSLIRQESGIQPRRTPTQYSRLDSDDNGNPAETIIKKNLGQVLAWCDIP